VAKKKFILVDTRTGKAVSAKTFSRSKSKKYKRILVSTAARRSTERSIKATKKLELATAKRIARIERKIQNEKDKQRSSKRTLRKLREERADERARLRAARSRAKTLSRIFARLKRRKKTRRVSGGPKTPRPISEWIVAFTYTSGKSFDVIVQALNARQAIETAKAFLGTTPNGRNLVNARFHNWKMEAVEGGPSEPEAPEFRSESRNS
jgi:hypothetical protein